MKDVLRALAEVIEGLGQQAIGDRGLTRPGDCACERCVQHRREGLLGPMNCDCAECQEHRAKIRVARAVLGTDEQATRRRKQKRNGQ